MPYPNGLDFKKIFLFYCIIYVINFLILRNWISCNKTTYQYTLQMQNKFQGVGIKSENLLIEYYWWLSKISK